MAKVLTKNKELLLYPVLLVFEELDIINALLKLFVVLLLKCINIEDEKVAVVTADPGKTLMHSATE